MSWAKDADEVLDYVVEWSKRLEGDTITESEWILPAGITSPSDSHTTDETTIWLSEGITGETYVLVNRVTTAGGRVMDASMPIFIRER